MYNKNSGSYDIEQIFNTVNILPIKHIFRILRELDKHLNGVDLTQDELSMINSHMIFNTSVSDISDIMFHCLAYPDLFQLVSTYGVTNINEICDNSINTMRTSKPLIGIVDKWLENTIKSLSRTRLVNDEIVEVLWRDCLSLYSKNQNPEREVIDNLTDFAKRNNIDMVN